MLDVMSCLDEFDAIFFLPKDNDRIHIQSNVYKDKGTPIEGNAVGDKWHVILFQEDDEDDDNLVVKNFDTFEAIFSDPREYISGLIPSGWYGMVAKKTTTSKAFVDDMLARVKEVL